MSEDWRVNAECWKNPDPKIWFPDNGAISENTRKICWKCPVRDECRDDFLAEEGTKPTKLRHGNQWGMQANERARYARAFAAGDEVEMVAILEETKPSSIERKEYEAIKRSQSRQRIRTKRRFCLSCETEFESEAKWKQHKDEVRLAGCIDCERQGCETEFFLPRPAEFHGPIICVKCIAVSMVS